MKLSDKITNIRYGKIHDGHGSIDFDFGGKGRTITIAEPADVLLVGWPGAAEWIATHYGFLLANC